MAKDSKKEEPKVNEPLDLETTIENLKKQAEDFANQEEWSKAMKNKALGAIEALGAIKKEEVKENK
tara:strand:+ start:600 stop:797 length:198 start_codon:yes stop_codon:yes gene_type:complete